MIPGYFEGCCASGNFLGSSRTYVYLATKFDGFAPEPVSPATVGVESRCIQIQSHAYGLWPRNYPNLNFLNSLIIKNNRNDYEFSQSSETAGLQDRTEALYETIILGKDMSHYVSKGQAIAWRDNGIIRGILSPLFIAGWMNCFGQPCYPCTSLDLRCEGGPESFLNNLGDLMDRYWNIEKKHIPWEGFIQDWYGIIERRAEPATGWQIYLMFGGIYCAPCGAYDEYCSCCWWCFLKDCIEPFFIGKIYGGSVLTLNQKRGIPFLSKDKLVNYYNKIGSDVGGTQYGQMNIKLDHVSDEYVFFEGSANWKNGEITFNKINRPASGLKDAISESNGEATLVPFGSGVNVNIVTDCPTISRTGDQGFLTRDFAVKYKTQEYFKDQSDVPWLHVDIPNGVSIEKSYITFTYDNNNLPIMVYGGGIPWNPGSFPWSWQNQRKLMVRSKEADGGFRTYTQLPPLSNGNKEPVLTYYYKRYIKKIVKAPYHLYVKDGENSFRLCKLGETLKDLAPGRYYFPNPAIANRQMGPFDPDLADLFYMDLVDLTEPEILNYFNTRSYRQFSIEPGKKYTNSLELIASMKNATLEQRYYNALALLGPLTNSASIEYGGSFEYSSESFNVADFNNFLQNSQNISTAIENYFSIPR